MDNIERVVKIENAPNAEKLEISLSNYRQNGFSITKIEPLENNRYTIYMEKQLFSAYALFLDDERIPHKVTWVNLPLVDWTIVRNYQQFVDIITKQGVPKYITFDHDLADSHYQEIVKTGNFNYENHTEKTGFECAKWLVEYCRQKDLDIPKYWVHSMNPIGRENIIRYLENYKLWRVNLKSLS